MRVCWTTPFCSVSCRSFVVLTVLNDTLFRVVISMNVSVARALGGESRIVEQSPDERAGRMHYRVVIYR